MRGELKRVKTMPLMPLLVVAEIQRGLRYGTDSSVTET